MWPSLRKPSQSHFLKKNIFFYWFHEWYDKMNMMYKFHRKFSKNEWVRAILRSRVKAYFEKMKFEKFYLWIIHKSFHFCCVISERQHDDRGDGRNQVDPGCHEEHARQSRADGRLLQRPLESVGPRWVQPALLAALVVRSGQVRSGQVRSGQVRVFNVHIQSKLL